MLFGHRWIGLDGPVAWSPRSPDLYPLDVFLGALKAIVYKIPIDSDMDLVARIGNAATIREKFGIYENSRQSIRRSCHACVNANR
ncbi:hypothetical protein AVEN_172260-1 [Araneus ventricosus]|uniref:Uncharacterized protein n=1 Tax=Araneus ventricosus TaxID=182803 RepID=A0A4Y2KE99_ARAVE|nr:hypothetical protein AVEN_172260-1 [Araneus ventricosus]